MNLLFPLDLFYNQAGLPLPEIAQVAGEDVPEPYRQLLVHTNDMTPTLEAFWGERVGLRVLGRRHQGNTYSREVVLTLNSDARPIEFGAIIVHLEAYPPEARESILTERFPLGTLLALHQIPHFSCPQAFVRVVSDAVINEALELSPEPRVLYGRRNILATPENVVLADILEILPPAHEI